MLETINIGENIQEGINFVVKNDKFKDATARFGLDTVYKNVFRRQNPYEVLSKDILRCYAQNLIIGNLLSKIGGTNLKS